MASAKVVEERFCVPVKHIFEVECRSIAVLDLRISFLNMKDDVLLNQNERKWTIEERDGRSICSWTVVQKIQKQLKLVFVLDQHLATSNVTYVGLFGADSKEV